MGSQYEGNPDNFPNDYTIPDDSDPPTAAAVNVGLEALGDRTAFLKARVGVLRTETYLASQTIQKPAGADAAIVSGCGGGGGGGGGGNNPGVDKHIAGGGGGAGSVLGTMLIDLSDVADGEDLAVGIGPGGAGGVNGATPAHGDNGGNTTLTRVSGSVLLARFAGAGGGCRGMSSSNGLNGVVWGLGGEPVAYGGARFEASDLDVTFKDLYRHEAPGSGGNGNTRNNGIRRPGRPSVQAHGGGAPGTSSLADSGSYRGGGNGGGGGGGPFGPGGTGGNGGDANSGGNGGDGTAGNSPSGANTGAGGGGGGPAGGGSMAGGVGARGGDGSAGRLMITWLKRGLI